ncbi:MAG: MFS transporter, partial [Proteobacteria bacterium]|nr:MFS transporter [Pseudomonadota bacterium]
IALVKAGSRAFDALTDPLMGWLSDRTRSRLGRRRPWMLAGAPLCAVAFVLMFAPPEELGVLSATAWFAVTYTAYYAFHTMYQIPHYGLGAELTQDYAERSSVFGWAEGFAVAGTLVAATVPPLLINATGGERSGYAAFAVIFGSLLTLLYFHLVWRVKERPDFVNQPPNPLIPGVRRVMRNRPFRLLLAVYLIGAVTGAIPGLLMPYFTKYVLMPEDPNTWLAIYLATYFGAGFVCLPLWVAAARRFGKKPIWLLSFVTAITGLGAIFLFVGEGDTVAMLLILIWTGSSFSARLFLAPAIQADVIDYDELYSGRRREAQYGGIWSVMQKFTVIPSMSIPLAVLASIGYEPNVEQSDGVKLAIRSIFALAPAATAVLALALAWFYPITEDVHRRILGAIEQHKRGEPGIDPLSGQAVPPPADLGPDEESGWFLDHFSMRELEALVLGRKGAGFLVRRTFSATAISLALTAASVAAVLAAVGDWSEDPGLLAVFAVLAVGLSFTATVFHAIRAGAALRMRRQPLARDRIERHFIAVRSLPGVRGGAAAPSLH